MSEGRNKLVSFDWPAVVQRVRARTPARLLEGRSGAAYRTGTQMELRAAHAAARDAVRTELDLQRDFGPDFVDQWRLFEVNTQARDKDEYLLRPDLGRHLSEESRAKVSSLCPHERDLQILIGDGLSVTAVMKQVPSLLPLLDEEAQKRQWTVGRCICVRYCRVGLLNEVGELLAPRVAILLIGERPGLATDESLSAYLAYQPKKAHTDAQRNLISNIHDRGTRPRQAATRIINLAERLMQAKSSGFSLRERHPAIEG